MTLSRAEISKIAQEAASKVLEGQTTCVSAGMKLWETQESFRRATPVIFRVNLKGLVSEDDLKVPHSELAIHTGAAGKNLIAFALTGTQTGLATYDEGEGSCGFLFGREDELFRPSLLKKVNEMWEKRGPASGGNPMAGFTPEVQAVIDKWKGQIAKGEPLVESEARREIIRAAGYKGGVGETDRAMRAIKAEGSNPGAKEPWQMTREEYVKSAREWRAEFMPRLTGRALEDELEHVAGVHKGVVFNALGAGKPIPPEVLADYPDLQKVSNPGRLPTRDDVRVEVWEERDRLHIGIQNKETGNYYASWWDDEARQMFEDGFFKPAPHLEGSVLEYAEEMGILAA